MLVVFCIIFLFFSSLGNTWDKYLVIAMEMAPQLWEGMNNFRIINNEMCNLVFV